MKKLGATGRFPQGKVGPHDEGELRLAITRTGDGLVRIFFGKRVAWLAFDKADAIAFARMILKQAGEAGPQ